MIIHNIPETQLEAIAAKAKAALPLAVNGRIEKAIRLVRSASVELHADGSATVISESDGLTGYRVADGQCSCPDFDFQAPDGWCAHRIAVAMAIRCHKQATQPSAEPSDTATPLTASSTTDATTGLPDTLKPHIVHLHGKPFVQYAGLLALAHERGLVSLKAHFISVTPELALAEAEATFANGTFYGECADSTPQNVGPKVRPHFARMALTRAKARALRDALNINLCSVEELEEA